MAKQQTQRAGIHWSWLLQGPQRHMKGTELIWNEVN